MAGFSAITLTAIFGVYALTLLATLLVFGSLSDHLGRRRVIAVALVAGAGACGLFLAAHGVGLLFAARTLQGAAVGTALNGFYLSLGPSLAAQMLHSPDLLWGGLVIFLVTGTGTWAAATVAFRGLSDHAAMLAGCLFLLAGAVMTIAAIETASAAAFLAGGAVAVAVVGTGFFLGAYRILTSLAGPGQRAGLVAAI